MKTTTIFVPDNDNSESFLITITAVNAAGESVASDPFRIYPYIPSSNVCFLADTEVETDQGVVAIQNLKPGKHTFDNMKLLCVTMTHSIFPFLIQLSKGCLGENVPSQDLVTTFYHKIYYGGKFVEAGRLFNVEGVKIVPYKDEILYNIVLEDYSSVKIYNLACETLSKETDIAKHFAKKPTFEVLCIDEIKLEAIEVGH